MKSIAIPALGTGSLGYLPAISAQKMFQAVEQFAVDNKTGSLCDIRFVIYPSDTANVEVSVINLT